MIETMLSEISPLAMSHNRYCTLLESTDDRSKEVMARASHKMRNRILWNVNSTASGGGVAELLQSLVPYARAFEIDARWLVIKGSAEFFAITKRIHHALLGEPREEPPLSHGDRAVYELVLRTNLPELTRRVRPGDVVFLHDPQTAGLAPALCALRATVIWRCHIGTDIPNEHTAHGWQFLSPYLRDVAAVVVSRKTLVREGVDESRVAVIAPSIDPFSPKNQPLDGLTTQAILSTAGLVGAERFADGIPTFLRSDNSIGRVSRRAVVVRDSSGLDPSLPLVVQISRWDSLKDPIGVIKGFITLLHAPSPVEAHLMLAGPDVASVADDPEDCAALEKVMTYWKEISPVVRRRIHLALLPTADVAENAAMVNALQRHAAVVVQKSLKEGFGLTVTEAMWKSRPIVASGVGGILEQIEHGIHGLLIDDPTDLDSYAKAVRRLLHDAAFANRLGMRARQRVESQFLCDRQLTEYAQLLNGVDIAEAPTMDCRHDAPTGGTPGRPL